MKTSPIFPRNEAANYCSYAFDPQPNFSQFLEEARKHTWDEGNFAVAPGHGPRETRKTQQLKDGEKIRNKKKSWKSSLLSWLMTGKKSKHLQVEPVDGPATLNRLRRGIVSGPLLHGGGGFIPPASRPRKPTASSGPLMNLFNPAKNVEEDGIPYASLSQLTNPHQAQSYGPVYLVT